MAIPTYESFMYPFLKMLEDGKEHTLQEAYHHLADYFQLTEQEKEERLPSGKQRVYHNRIGWARTYLANARLIKVVRRATFVLTERGREIIADPEITELTQKDLLKFKEFQDFKNRSTMAAGQTEREVTREVKSLDPQEQMEEAFRIIEQQISDEILEKVKACTPEFFERLVVELLVAMGYGGSIQDAGKAVGKSGDEGIDGIIKEDILGLDMIYIQAKRWEGVVGRPEIQKFAGSLEGKRARKGVFITTSDFTKEAREYVTFIEKKII